MAQGLKRRNLDKNGNMNDDRRGTQHNECLFVISLVNLGDGVVGDWVVLTAWGGSGDWSGSNFVLLHLFGSWGILGCRFSGGGAISLLLLAQGISTKGRLLLLLSKVELLVGVGRGLEAGSEGSGLGRV